MKLSHFSEIMFDICFLREYNERKKIGEDAFMLNNALRFAYGYYFYFFKK